MKPKHLICLTCVWSCLICACDDSSSGARQTSCPDGQNLNADTGQCESSHTCDTEDDCPNAQICVENKCTTKSDGCASDKDCKNNRKCIRGECKDIKEAECSGDGDCNAPQICHNNQCITECTNHNDCTGDLVCRDNRCTVECNLDEDCSDNRVCRANVCEIECRNTNDCADDRVCVSNRCVYECETDDACENDWVCRDHQCGPECQNNDDCEGTDLCLSQKCVPPCTNDDDCDNSFICNEGLCEKDPLWCVIDDDCDNDFYCSRNHCKDPSIECYEDKDCTNGRVCKSNKCKLECVEDTDCADGFVCRSNRCRPECLSNSDCTLPSYCSGSRCIKDCTEDDDCISPYICKAGQCAAGCTKPSDCTDGKLCSNMRCVECVVNTDCSGSDMVCNLNTCENSTSVRYPCLILNNGARVYQNDADYNAAQNVDGSINLCKLGYYPSEEEISADPSKDNCFPLYTARPYDFYGDGIDSNCDGYDYNLADAIFVAKSVQGDLGGSDDKSGKFSPTRNLIEPKASLNSALQLSATTYRIDDASMSIYPDILVAADVNETISQPIVLRMNATHSPAALPKLPQISDNPAKTAYLEHSILVKEILSDASKSAQTYRFFTEGDYPTESIRIYGGFARNPKHDSNYLHWQYQDDQKSKQHWVISSIDRDSYVMVGTDGSLSVSLAMSDFEMSMSSSAKALPHGTTFVGLSCGSLGCADLNLNRTRWTITAPDGVSRTTALDAGADGNNGKNGVRVEGDTSLYTSETWCAESQICADVYTTGTGGCGGHIAKINDKDGDKSANYDGSDDGYLGQNGTNGQNVSLGGSVVKGGSGGKGLTTAGITHDGCNSDTSVDSGKGRGADGKNGENGRNGSHSLIKLTLAAALDHSTLYFASNYDTVGEIKGMDGAAGGGGGGGAVYRAFSSQWVSHRSWISAGSGGNGGCGGKGGEPGGTGGSAIGLVLSVPISGDANIKLTQTSFHTIAGSGGSAQNGSDGGLGGKGGNEIGYAKENLSYDLYCDKATAGGNGGNGGGGGAGAGGVAGNAVSFLFTCNRDVTANCAEASYYKPCFTADSRTTLENCGYRVSQDFVYSLEDPAFGTQTPGKTVADSTDTTEGKGAKAGTDLTNGTTDFIRSWIGSL